MVSVPAEGRSWTFEDLTPGVTYEFQVQAILDTKEKASLTSRLAKATIPSPLPDTQMNSTRHCSDLDWEWAIKESTERVCAVGAPSTSNCQKLNHAGATSLCESLGARLCTSAELFADAGSKSGCDLDVEAVWTSTGCSGGEHAVAQAGSIVGLAIAPAQCMPLDKQLNVMCCADASEPDKDIQAVDISLKSCSDLEWPVEDLNPSICASSEVGGKCSGKMSYLEAEQFCEDSGTRLCTSAELSIDAGIYTGCDLDSSRVWTATSTGCQKGEVLTRAGSTAVLESLPVQCAHKDQVFGARCCADVDTTSAKVIRPRHLPPAFAIAGQFFSYDLSGYFRSREVITFSVAGLPVGSGLSVGGSGLLLQGTPSAADVVASQPLLINVTAHGSSGSRVGRTLSLTVARAEVVNGVYFSLDTYSDFAARTDESLEFSILGIPAGSGIEIDESSGRIFGIPSPADAFAVQPMGVLVLAKTSAGETLISKYNLVVVGTFTAAHGTNVLLRDILFSVLCNLARPVSSHFHLHCPSFSFFRCCGYCWKAALVRRVRLGAKLHRRRRL